MSTSEAEEFWARAQRIEGEKHAARRAAVYENFRAQFPGAPCTLRSDGEGQRLRLWLRFRRLEFEVCDGVGRRAVQGERWVLWHGQTRKGVSMLADCGDLFRLCADWEAEVARTTATPGRRLTTRQMVSFRPVAAHLVGRLKPTGEGIRRWYAMVVAWLTGRSRGRYMGEAS